MRELSETRELSCSEASDGFSRGSTRPCSLSPVLFVETVSRCFFFFKNNSTAQAAITDTRNPNATADHHGTGGFHPSCASLFLTASVVTSYTEISDDVATFSPSAVFLVEPSDDFGFCGFSFRIAGEKKFSGSLRLFCSANVSTFILECGLVVFSVVVVALDVALSVVVSATGTSLWVKSGSKRSFSTGACVTVVGLVVEAAVVFGVVVVVVLAVVVVVGLVVETG